MATYTTANAVGEREDLSNVIARIDPDETPVFSNAKNGFEFVCSTELRREGARVGVVQAH